MNIKEATTQNLITDVLSLGSDKAAEFILTEDSFDAVIANPAVSRLLGEVVKLNGERVQHFYIAPMTIHPSRIVRNAMLEKLHKDEASLYTAADNFRSPAFIVRATSRNRVSYGDFSFYPLVEPSREAWLNYYKYSTINNVRGDILLNNTYAERSGNWCFGHLNISELYQPNQKVDSFYGVHAIESIIVNFINASPNHDLSWFNAGSSARLYNLGINEVRNWNSSHGMFGFWLVQRSVAQTKGLDITKDTPELRKALDAFWTTWISANRGHVDY